jgi:hypothetical protein
VAGWAGSQDPSAPWSRSDIRRVHGSRVRRQGRCGCPAGAADRGSARESRATGTGRRTGVANLGASAGAWVGDGRPGCAPESQIGEESRAVGDGGGKEETGADFL